MGMFKYSQEMELGIILDGNNDIHSAAPVSKDDADARGRFCSALRPKPIT